MLAGTAGIFGTINAARIDPNHDWTLLAYAVVGMVALTLAAYVLDKAINR